MINALRRSTGSWPVKIMLGLLVASFALWGIGDIFRGGSDTTVATVGNERISGTQFYKQVQRELERLQGQLGGGLTMAQARLLGLDRQVLGRMTGRIAYGLYHHELGLAATDDGVRRAIQANQAFFDEFATFDRFQFETMLRRAGISEQEYVISVRQDIMRSQVNDTLSRGIRVPKALAGRLYRYRGERRLAEYLVIPYGGIDPGAPGEAALEDVHRQNSARFTVPELRDIGYVGLSPADLVPEVSIAEDDLLAEYAAREGQYTVPEKRRVDQIMLPDEATAQALLQRLRAGAGFAELALSETASSAEDTDLGEVTRGDILPSLADAAFTAPEGGYSEPAQSDFGWHLFRIRAVTPGSVQSYAEVREELRAELALELARDALYDYSTGIDDALAGGATLEELASRFALELHKARDVDGGGNGIDGRPSPGLPADREFLDEAFSLVEGVESPLIETAGGQLFVLRVDGVTPSRLRPLDQVRGEVLELWRRGQQRRGAEATGKTIMSGVALGRDLWDQAKEHGLKVVESGPLARNVTGPNPKISLALRVDLFKLEIGQTAGGPLAIGADTDGGGYVVAQLTEIRDADPLRDRAGLGLLEAGLENAIPQDMVLQYQAAVLAAAGVTVNQWAIDSLFSAPSGPPILP